MGHHKKAFLIAFALYLPFLIGLWHAQQKLLITPSQMVYEEYYPMPRYIGIEDLPTLVSEPTQSLYPDTRQAPAPATDADKQPAASDQPQAEVAQERAETDIFAPTPLSAQQLSEAFERSEDERPDRSGPLQESTVPPAEVADLYGAMLYDLSPKERTFIEDKLEGIGRITQRYLRYPDLAGRLRMSGEVILAFTLLPGGDITPIEVLKSSGYSLLDDNAIYTVEIAHKDYPHPDEPVRIRLRVIYRLY